MNRPAALALFFCAGCQVVASVGDTPDQLWTELRLGQSHNDKIDLLFMIDNSPSMAPKQNELRARFPQLLQALDPTLTGNRPIHLHIGVVTSDLGAGPFNINMGQCRPGGDGGRLVAVGAFADPARCKPPTDGRHFIDFDQASGASNLPPDVNLASEFGCMTEVGDTGCGFESQLESVYAALHDPPPENAGFLRPDALLAVVFLTDEDDCSAPPDTDLFDPGPDGLKYGALLSYRCTQYGIQCGMMPAAPPYDVYDAQLSDCVPAPNPGGAGPGKLYDVGRYIDFFRRPASAGGVKEFPGDAFLFAIDAPAAPVEVLNAALKAPVGPFQFCTGPVDGVNCATVLQHSCVSPGNSAFFGDPAVRLNAVVGATLPGIGTSICDDSYQPAMSALASTLISYQNGNGCLPGPLPDPADPACRVLDEYTDASGALRLDSIPECDRVQDAPPCWAVVTSGECAPVVNVATHETQNLQLVINRGDTTPPPGSTPRASCVILTH
jgi:hypothetical protein